MTLARVLGAVGRISLTAGILVLLFVGYQLWGTGLHEARAQSALEDEFEHAFTEAGVDATAAGGESPATAAVGAPSLPSAPPPTAGDAVAELRIPRIGVDKIVVEGVSVEDLKRGPGHYPGSPLPGQPGNASIAGHRTTYGAPFHRIDELEPGDEILVTTLQGEFQYTVIAQLIVSPHQVEVLDDFGDSRLSLTACHPKYSAAQRIVVVAELEGDEAATVEVEPGVDTSGITLPDLDAGLSGEGASTWPAIMLGLACGLIWLTTWAVARLVRPVIAYAIGAPVFFAMLFVFYENVARLLPANF